MTARSTIDDVGGPGEEIEAVIRLNAEAANRIMDAAEAISLCVDVDQVPQDVRFAALNQVTAIFEACGFQDLTGQRIQRALRTLRSIEESMLGRKVADAAPNPKVNQTYVDDVFAGTPSTPAAPSDQAAIDKLFD